MNDVFPVDGLPWAVTGRRLITGSSEEQGAVLGPRKFFHGPPKDAIYSSLNRQMVHRKVSGAKGTRRQSGPGPR